MKKRIAWGLAAAGTIGLAVVMAAVALLLTGSRAPTASATNGCALTLTKTAEPSDYVSVGSRHNVDPHDHERERCGLQSCRRDGRAGFPHDVRHLDA